MENLPLWPFAPNWTRSVTQTFEWLTDILRSPVGAEQRRAMRRAPRRYFEYQLTARGREREILDSYLTRVGTTDWHLPIWPDTHIVPASVPAGSIVLPVPNAGMSDFVTGAGVHVEHPDPVQAAAIEVAAVNVGSIGLAESLPYDVVAGTRVWPTVRARMTEYPSFSRVTDELATATMRMQALDASPLDVVTPGVMLPGLIDTLDGFSILRDPPDEKSSLTFQIERLTETLDNSTGRPFFRDPTPTFFARQQYAWARSGRAEFFALRSLFASMRGRAIPLWLPTFYSDVELLMPAAADSIELTVKNFGYTASGGPRDGRRDLAFEMLDGTRVVRRVAGAAVNDIASEIITLEEPIGIPVSAASVLRISFLALSRLDQDLIEFEHTTDLEGPFSVTAVMKNVPDIRKLAS